MVSLMVDFQDGFFEDLVIVEIDDHEVFRRADLRTRVEVGLSGSIKLETASGESRLRVSLPDRNISAETLLDVERTPYLGVSLDKDALVLKPAQKPYRYL